MRYRTKSLLPTERLFRKRGRKRAEQKAAGDKLSEGQFLFGGPNKKNSIRRTEQNDNESGNKVSALQTEVDGMGAFTVDHFARENRQGDEHELYIYVIYMYVCMILYMYNFSCMVFFTNDVHG